ncbi:zinc finger protein-like protein [Leptotrombidium deliense]|uniref:Zinc finger protein-like protein n=1 Tax=Leptotrombidium deliense TaxID=299467 RepID=A0A443SNC0_9ACAR|nr:zinc finger protein-like protein [Leptotrombidium deliense]
MEAIRNPSSLEIAANKKPKVTPIIVLPSNSQSLSKLDENNCSNGRMNVQYISVAYHNNDNSFMNGVKQEFILNSHKDNSLCENEKKCFNSMPLENMSNLSDSESSSLKTGQQNCNQRVLISPTDFLTLSEEVTTIKSSAVKRDVNLSTSCLEIIKRSDNNMAISLERYCESPFLLESQRENQLISDDDASNNGRVSRLSESHEDITTDDLFATTLGDQHPALREVVITPVDSESPRTTPVNKDFIRYLNNDLSAVKEEKFDTEEETLGEDCKSDLAMLHVNNHSDETISPENMDMKPTVTTATLNNVHESNNSQVTSTNCITMAVPVAPLDIKILPTGLLQLAANIAAVFPTSTMQKQIALQLLREDGTSIIVPLTTRGNESFVSDTSASANSMENMTTDSASSSHASSHETGQNLESDRPFKCELCNSTFTRLGNYTRHKKIHSLPSKVSLKHMSVETSLIVNHRKISDSDAIYAASLSSNAAISHVICTFIAALNLIGVRSVERDTSDTVIW